MKKIFFYSVIASACVILTAFFMPWASINTTAAKATRHITGALRENLGGFEQLQRLLKKVEKAADIAERAGDIRLKASVSGYNVPVMANRGSSGLAVSLLQVFAEDAASLDRKSYLVYIVPFLGVICALLAWAGLRYIAPVAVMLFLSGGVSIITFCKIKTADISALPVDISIERGLWYTISAFFFIFIISALWLATYKRRA